MAGPPSPRVEIWMLPGMLARVAADGAAIDGSIRGSGLRRTARDWVVDSALFALAVGVGAEEFWSVVAGNQLGLPMWARVGDVVLGVVLCMALWWRRRAPLALGIAAAVTFAVSNTGTGAAFLLVFSLAVHGGWTRAVPVAGAAFVLGIPYIAVYVPDLQLVALFGLGLTVVVSAGLGVRVRRRLVLSLRQQAATERAEHAQRLTEIRLQERARLAREMHDVLAHRISLLSVHAGALEYRTAMAQRGVAPTPTAAEMHAAASVVRSNAHLALSELQDVLSVLREPGTAPDAADRPQPTADRIPQLITEARSAGQGVDAAAGLDARLADLPSRLQRTSTGSCRKDSRTPASTHREHGSGSLSTSATTQSTSY